MSITPRRTPARIRAVVVAVLVLAFVIPWTYAHIAYAWPWKRFQTGTLISCDDQYLVGGFPNKPPELLGHLSDGAPVDFIAGGEINMGVETGDFGLAAQRGNEIDNFAHSPQLHLGESTTIDGVGGVWVFRTVCFERVVLSSPGCLWPGRMDYHEEVLEAHA